MQGYARVSYFRPWVMNQIMSSLGATIECLLYSTQPCAREIMWDKFSCSICLCLFMYTSVICIFRHGSVWSSKVNHVPTTLPRTLSISNDSILFLSKSPTSVGSQLPWDREEPAYVSVQLPWATRCGPDLAGTWWTSNITEAFCIVLSLVSHHVTRALRHSYILHVEWRVRFAQPFESLRCSIAMSVRAPFILPAA